MMYTEKILQLEDLIWAELSDSLNLTLVHVCNLSKTNISMGR